MGRLSLKDVQVFRDRGVFIVKRRLECAQYVIKLLKACLFGAPFAVMEAIAHA